jgi:hypothetical protein
MGLLQAASYRMGIPDATTLIWLDEHVAALLRLMLAKGGSHAGLVDQDRYRLRSHLKSAQPTPLTAKVDDIVTWNNTNNEDHWPWPVGADGTPLPDDQVSPISGTPCRRIRSRAAYRAPTTTW